MVEKQKAYPQTASALWAVRRGAPPRRNTTFFQALVFGKGCAFNVGCSFFPKNTSSFLGNPY